jgi:hypothetical protein
MVVQVTPSSIKVEIDGKIAKVFGEGYLPDMTDHHTLPV